MSNYTTQLRFYVEMQSNKNKPVEKQIEDAIPKLFDFDYPIWDNDYKPIS